MKYIDFINEQKSYDNTKKLDIEEFKKIYNKLDSIIPFYRGMKNAPSEIMLVDGKKRKRKSIDIGNHYTIGFDEVNPDYPKRSNAVFFSGTDNVKYFGNTYYAFPLNDTKIARITHKDMWSAYTKIPHDDILIDMKQFIDILDNLKISDTSISAMEKDIIRLMTEYDESSADYVELMSKKKVSTEFIEREINNKRYIDALYALFAFNKANVSIMLNKVFSSESLDADLYKSAKNVPNYRGHYEYWCDGEVMLIDKRIFDQLDDIKKYDPDA